MQKATGEVVTAAETSEVELAVQGMTCAACAARIERKLNRLGGVVAVVNYATGQARVTAPAGMPATKLVGAVEEAGYSAAVIRPELAGGRGGRRRAESPGTCSGV